MAKINVRPLPGALSELLKKKGMPQVDAHEKTHTDRKTLAKIDRAEEVKLETLQKVANKLGVPVDYFLPLAPTAEGNGDGDVPEPGTIMLRKLDGPRLEELLQGAENVRWHLKAPVRDDASRKFLEEFEQAVENFRKQLKFNIPEAWDGDPSLRFQLNLLQHSDDVAIRLCTFTDHGFTLLGADHLFWECNSEEYNTQNGLWTRVDYRNTRTVLLSVEPAGTQPRRAPVSQGSLPPRFSPGFFRGNTTTIFVNGVELPCLADSNIPSLQTFDDDIPF